MRAQGPTVSASTERIDPIVSGSMTAVPFSSLPSPVNKVKTRLDVGPLKLLLMGVIRGSTTMKPLLGALMLLGSILLILSTTVELYPVIKSFTL